MQVEVLDRSGASGIRFAHVLPLSSVFVLLPGSLVEEDNTKGKWVEWGQSRNGSWGKISQCIDLACCHIDILDHERGIGLIDRRILVSHATVIDS
jgi:hypothetical protein